MAFLVEHGLTPAFMASNTFGPILFREECVFRKELTFGDVVTIDLKLSKAKPDFSRWSMVHQVWKNNDILAALITVDGAWIDTVKRKLTVPPALVVKVFDTIPKTTDFPSV